MTLVTATLGIVLACLQPLTGPPSAVRWKDQLLCFTSRAPYALGKTYRGSFEVGQKRIRDPLAYDTLTQDWGDHPAKLEVMGDRILFHVAGDSHIIAPLTAMPLLESSAFGKYLLTKASRPSRPKDSGYAFYPYTGYCDYLLDPIHRAADYVPPPVSDDDVRRAGSRVDLWQESRQVLGWKDYLSEARYSLQLAGPDTVRLFHAAGGKLFVSVEPDYLGLPFATPKEKLPKAPARELRVGKLPAGFDGHFAAYRVGEKEYTDYLVTHSGKVFACVPKGKDEVVITPVWDDPKQRVFGVLRDTDGVVYGFGYVGLTTNPARFVVKFEAKPEAKAYKMTAPLNFEPEDTYREAYECARAVAKAKK